MPAKYKFTTVHNHPFFPGKTKIQRSRLVMAESLGRSLLRIEFVHHKNENTMDDRRNNLEIMLCGPHNRLHHLGMYHTEETKKKISISRGRHRL